MKTRTNVEFTETVETFFPVKKISLQIISLPSSKVDLLKTQKERDFFISHTLSHTQTFIFI